MEMENGFDEFFKAFDGDSGDDGNQTGAAEPEDSVEEETGGEAETLGTQREGEKAPESGESESKADTGGSGEKPAEGSPEPDKGIPEQKFTIKVDKETREGLFDLVSLLFRSGAEVLLEELQTEGEKKTREWGRKREKKGK